MRPEDVRDGVTAARRALSALMRSASVPRAEWAAAAEVAGIVADDLGRISKECLSMAEAQTSSEATPTSSEATPNCVTEEAGTSEVAQCVERRRERLTKGGSPMAAEEERRAAAERLRAEIGWGMSWPGTQRLSVILGVEGMYETGWEGRFLGRLADLIDPGCDASATHTDASTTRDMSQNCRDAVVCDRDMLYVIYSRSTCGPDGMAYMVRVRHRDKGWERDFYAVDREALSRLAHVLDNIARGYLNEWPHTMRTRTAAELLEDVAASIREACGEAS